MTNLLFVFVDQLRKYDLGCYGSRQVISPAIDALAGDGLVFEHCLSNAPLCVPVRGSLLTGLFPQKHKAFTNDMSIRYDIPSVADALNAVGYRTGYIGKWHLCGIPREQYIDKDRRLGFTEWKVANCNHNYTHVYYDDEDNVRHHVPGYEPEIFGSLGEEFIRRNADKPWALYLSFATPHDPHGNLPEYALDPYRDVRPELPPNVPETGILMTREKHVTRQQMAEDARGYFAHITAIDHQMENLVLALKETGQYDNTLIVFTADHGDLLGSQGLTDKQTAYREAVDVPLIMHHPALVKNGRTDALMGLVDLPVTLLSALGLTMGGETDGKDLSHVMQDPSARGLDDVYMFDLYPCHNAYSKGLTAWRALRTDRYTYCINEKGPLFLFDNETDPYQMHNLKDDPACAGLRSELHARLMRHVNQHDALISGDEYVRRSGWFDEFNASQRYFHVPELTP